MPPSNLNDDLKPSRSLRNYLRAVECRDKRRAELKRHGRHGEAQLLMINALHHFPPELIQAYIKRYNH